MKNKKLMISTLVSAVLAVASIPFAHAGLQEKMDSMFGEMSNITNPGVFETQRRGVISGGSIYVRNPMMTTSLVDLQMPSWKAGCGGIDLFGGSFSFINADQFVQLLRTVAANAKGYAFQVALDIACPQCMTWINNLQAKIQELNNLSANSCQLANGIVNDVASAAIGKRYGDYSLTGTMTGLYDDFFGAKNQVDGTDTPKVVAEKAPEQAKKLYGNIVWDSLAKSKAKGWITGAGSEDEEYGILMATSGSIIIPAPEEDAVNPDTGTTINPRHLPHKIEFKNLLDGGQVVYYSCGNDPKCMNPTEKRISVVGMVSRVHSLLTGDGHSVGVIQKFAMTSGNDFTQAEQNFMSNLPHAVGMMIRNLSTASPETALSMAQEIAYAVAMYMAYNLLDEQLRVVEQALNTSDKTETKDMIAKIKSRRTALFTDYEKYGMEHTTMDKLVSYYNSLQQNIYKTAVIIANSTTPIASEGRGS